MKKGMEAIRRFLKLHRRLELWGCAVLLVAIAFLVVRNIGIPEELEENRNAAVITEAGDLIPCEVQVRGSVTRYPLKGTSVVDTLSVWLEDRLVVEFEGGRSPYSYSTSYRYTGILCRAEEVILAEVDHAYLFPEKESLRCVLTVPAADAGAVRKLLTKIPIPDNLRDSFAWLMEEP